MTDTDLTTAADAAHQGQLIIYPTDTLYALGATIHNTNAIHHLYTLKKRPTTQPLSIAVPNTHTMNTLAHLTPTAQQIATRFLPGPRTLILNKKPTIPDLITAGQPTIAIRIPNDPTALQLLNLTGPLTATSANIHGHPAPTTITAIKQQLHAPNLIGIDRGPRAQNASTIIDLTSTPPRILRHGPITQDTLMEALHG